MIDKEVENAINAELQRQKEKIELIASENFVSDDVLEAMGSIMTNKYAEGYPGKRYYGGCQNVDAVETLAIERAKELFKAEHANVQPHSGSQANMAVYMSVLKPGDTILSMSLECGGHLTHGSPVSFSGKLYNVVHYGVDENGYIDYDEVERLAKEHEPKMIVAGASAYPRVIDFARFKNIAEEVGAFFMVDMAHIAGLVAVGLHPSPVPFADFVTATTHKTLRGPRGGLILCKEKYAKAIDKSVFPGVQGGPLEHIIAAKAVCFGEALKPEFYEYQKQVLANAKTLAERLIDRGFDLVSGGTDNHLILIDLRSKNITGKDAELLLDNVGVTVNKNAIPRDPQKPNIASGIRIGTPAMTTRGMTEEEMKKIAAIIDVTLRGEDSNKIKAYVKDFTSKFPLFYKKDLT